jgi:D-alanyl-D-alanine carboxypeptidase/D-alanyl-D-alanine-endopeptidase (penicillin-binding protein 4)
MGLLVAVTAAFHAIAQEPVSDQKASNERRDVGRFRERVESTLASNGAERAYWGAVVMDAETGETLYSLNADHYFKPASNVKLFTTAMALGTLGPDFRIRTTMKPPGQSIKPGTAGDVTLVGRGDPNLSNRVFPFASKEALRDRQTRRWLSG